MEMRHFKQSFIKCIRLYPVLALSLLAIIYLLGGFNTERAPVLPRFLLTGTLYLLVGVVPVVAIAGFITLSITEDRSRARGQRQLENLPQEDPFELAYEKMCGFKVVAITGESPIFTGITGDNYSSDDSAKCQQSPDHVPPVSNCECGFYAYKSRSDAEFELTMHPGLFLINVDLFGLGFAHKYGYRAESQRVNSVTIPRRCMRCKTLPAKIFVKSYKLGYGDGTWWQWSIRCLLCSKKVKAENTLTMSQMGQSLQVSIE